MVLRHQKTSTIRETIHSLNMKTNAPFDCKENAGNVLNYNFIKKKEKKKGMCFIKELRILSIPKIFQLTFLIMIQYLVLFSFNGFLGNHTD